MGFPEKIVVQPDETARLIRDWLREHPGIAKSKYQSERGSVEGHCYVASEAYYHASDRDLDIYCLSHDAGTHWFLGSGTTVVDLGIEEPWDGLGIPYSEATRRAFITGYEPSRRARRVLAGIGVEK